jgi:hypothetical protein
MTVTVSSFVVALHINSAWVDITEDIRTSDPILFHYGIEGSGPLDRVASIGWATFTLDNSARNSAKLLGYYSPEHVNCLAGFTWGVNVRVTFTYAGIEYHKWTGRISEIEAVPGSKGERSTRIRAVDKFAEYARFDISRIGSMREDVASGDIFGDVWGWAFPLTGDDPVTGTTFDFGRSRFAFALDDLGGGMTALEAMQRIVQSEFGYAFLRGTTNAVGSGLSATNKSDLRFEERGYREANVLTPAVTLTDASPTVRNTLGFKYKLTADEHLYNHVQATVHPRVNVSADIVVLCQLPQGNTIRLEPAQVKRVWMDVRDPGQSAASLIGGTDWVAPAATTDYLANSKADGTGTDLTADLLIGTAVFGNMLFQLTNTGSQTMYVTKLQIRGAGVYDYGPQIVLSEDTDSQGVYGLRSIDIDMPYQNDLAVAEAISAYVLSAYKSASPNVEKVRFWPHGDATNLLAALTVEPGSRIAIEERVTGLTSTDSFWVQSVEFEVFRAQAGALFTVTWGLAPAFNVSGLMAITSCQATNSTTQSVNNTTDTAVTFDQDVFDAEGMHSTVSNTSRFTVPTGRAGTYMMMGNIEFAAMSANNLRCLGWFRKNGATRLTPYVGHPGVSGGITTVQVDTVAALAAGDYVELMAWHENGSALNIGNATGGANGNMMSIAQIG